MSLFNPTMVGGGIELKETEDALTELTLSLALNRLLYEKKLITYDVYRKASDGIRGERKALKETKNTDTLRLQQKKNNGIEQRE